MKNKLVDLNNHLFAQLERLNDEELKGDSLAEEIERSKAVSLVSNQIIANANLALQASKVVAEYGNVPEMFTPKQPEQLNPTDKKYHVSYNGK